LRSLRGARSAADLHLEVNGRRRAHVMADAATVLPGSVRPDGSVRPQVRVKKGYVPPDEQEKYVPTGMQEQSRQQQNSVPGADPDGVLSARPKSKTALKNEKRKAARAREAEGKEEPKEEVVDKVAQLAVAMGMAPPPAAAVVPTPPPPKPKPKAESKPPPEAAPAPAAVGNEVEKKVRALKKKLRGVDELVAKQQAGGELNADQLSKIEARGELEAEIARWESLSNLEELNKEVKKLGKKLRQIEELEERAASGEALNADQAGKVAQKEKVTAEHAKLAELLAQLK